MVTLDVRLAYRDDSISEWTELAHSFEQRKLSCNLTMSKVTQLKKNKEEAAAVPSDAVVL